VPAAQAGAAVTTDGVDLVDEDDAGRVLLALLEEVADAARADADEHLDEVRARDAEEGHAGLAAMARARSVLPVPGGPISSTPLGMRPPRRWNFFGSLRKAMISSTSSLASSMPATSANVTLFCESLSMPRLGLAEAHGLAAAGLELAHEEEEHDADEEHRQQRHERRRPEGRESSFSK
jgi:hypothetical protein